MASRKDRGADNQWLFSYEGVLVSCSHRAQRFSAVFLSEAWEAGGNASKLRRRGRLRNLQKDQQPPRVLHEHLPSRRVKGTPTIH